MPKGSKKKRSDHRPAADKAHSARESDHHPVLKATPLFPILIILLFSFAVYFNALFGDFVYDDTDQILNNTWIKDIGNIPTIFSKSVWSFEVDQVKSNYYRPLMHIVYMFNYHLFGLKPWGFHLVNVLFHCGVSVLVFLLGRKLLIDSRPSTFSADLASPFMAAMLFASHPIHTEAVTWIAGLPDVAFTFFYLLSFYLYVSSKGGLSGNYLFSVVCFAVAAFFKEPALTLPVILLAHDYMFREAQTRLLDYVKRYIPYLVIGVGYLALRIHALGGFAPGKMHVALSFYQYAINVFPLFTQYLEKLLAPLNLNTFYVFHPIASLFELKGALSFMVTVAFLMLFPIALKKNRVVFLGLLFATVPLLPVLYIPALGENTFAERYLYLPSAGYAILLTVFLSWVKEKLPHADRSITLILIVLMGLYIVGTVNRNSIWKNNFVLWSDAARKSPDSAFAHTTLGNEYESKGQLDMAIAEYQTALRLRPAYADAHVNLGVAYQAKGQLDMAIAEYQTALRLRPAYADAHVNLGVAYQAKGQLDMAIAEYQTALRLKPNYANAHNNLGIVYASKGQLDMAIAEYQTALRLKPDYANAHNNLGIVYASKGQLDMAIAEYQTALRLKPDYANAHFNLGITYLRKGAVDMAKGEFETGLKISPDNYKAREILNSIVSK